MKTLFIILPIILLIGTIIWGCASVVNIKEEKTREVEKMETDYYGKERTIKVQEKYYEDNKSKTIQTVISFILMIALVGVLVFIPASIHQVNAGEIAVVKVWGEAKEQKSAGLHFDLWISHKYEIYDAKVQQVIVETQAYSSDGQTMDIELVVQYQIQDALKIAVNYGGLDMLENRISTVSIEKMKSVLSQKSAMTIIETRATVSPDVETSIRNAITDDYYVSISTVVLTDISFTDTFEKVIEDKMVAEQQKLQAEYEKEKAIIQAEQQLEVAKKEAEAQLERAKKQAESEIEIAKGEAEALAIMNDAWNSLSAEVKEVIIKEMAIQKWDGKLPETMVGDEFIKELMGFINSK